MRGFAQTGPESVLVEGHGLIVRDAEGKEYIAGVSGIVNVNIGYSRKELAEAAMEQMLKFSSGGAGGVPLY